MLVWLYLADDGCKTTYVVVSLEVLWQVKLVLADDGARPRSALKRIKGPASPVVFAGELLVDDVAVDFGHGLQHVCHVLLLARRNPPLAPLAVADVAAYRGSHALVFMLRVERFCRGELLT